MKIAYLSNSIIPSRAANSIHVMKMCQAFALNGHEVVLFALNKKNEKERSVTNPHEYYGMKKKFLIKQMPCPNFRGRDWIYSYSILLSLKKMNPSLVYGRHLMACAHAARAKYRVIYELHFPVWQRSSRDRALFEELITRSELVRLVVITKALMNLCIDKWSLPPEKILVAPDGADPVEDESSLPQWTARPQCLQVGYIGHLYEGRGIDLIISLSGLMEDVDFHIIGGTESDIEYWKSQVSRSNIFFHGYIPPNQIHKYRNSCDILIAPYQESVSVADRGGDTGSVMSPLKIFEYMSSKKPIIASDMPAIREVLNPDNAVLVRPDSIQDWMKAIERLKDSKERSRIAGVAYEDFRTRYTWKNRAQYVISHMY